MSTNILITGAAGYIGGSLVAEFISENSTFVKKENVFAAVRSNEQAEALSALGIRVLQLDLTNEETVIESISQHNVNIVIHTASSIDSSLAIPLVNALAKQKEISGKETYLIHTSGLSAFYEKTGWPPGTFEDTGGVFDTEKRLADSFPIRKTDITITEHARSQGVTSFIVIPTTVYGKGTGPWNQLSVVLPGNVSGAIKRKTVYKFPENITVAGVHITDLTAIYKLIIEKVIQKENIPSGTEGYYFAKAHDLDWWQTLDHLAVAMKARDLVTESETKIWPNDEFAAESMGVPVGFVQALWNAGENMTVERPFSIGWKPKWNKERFLKNIDDEVSSVVELGKAKSSLIDSLHKAASTSH